MKFGGAILRPTSTEKFSFHQAPSTVCVGILEEKQHLSGQRSDLDSKQSLEMLLGTNRHQAAFDFNQLKP